MKQLIALFGFFALSLEASVEDHFKPALNKSGAHSIENIDFIYMINLDQRPEKFERCIQQLHPYGVYPYRFSAVNGWELTLEAIQDVGVKFSADMNGGFLATSYLEEDLAPFHEVIQTIGRTYFCHCMARGTIGIALSHLSVLQDALDSGYETIWVMEDDIEVIADPKQLSSLIKALDSEVGKDKWDILFTDQDIRDANGKYIPSYGYAIRPNYSPKNRTSYYKRKQIGKGTFMLVGSRFGAHSMIIRRSGMKKILDFIKKYKIFLPYDMDYYLPESMQIYSVMEDIVSNEPKAISDNGAPNYLKPYFTQKE